MGYSLKCVGPHRWLLDSKLESTGRVTLDVVEVADKQGISEITSLDVDVNVDDGPFGHNKVG